MGEKLRVVVEIDYEDITNQIENVIISENEMPLNEENIKMYEAILHFAHSEVEKLIVERWLSQFKPESDEK